MNSSLLHSKSYEFAKKIIFLHQNLVERREYVLSKQLLKSGTAIGALLREAEFGESKLDFIHKMNISLKEANETLYWLLLMKDTGYISVEQFEETHNPCKELVSLLVTSLKTLRKKYTKQRVFSPNTPYN